MLYSSIDAWSLPNTTRICNQLFVLISVFSKSKSTNYNTESQENGSTNDDIFYNIGL